MKHPKKLPTKQLEKFSNIFTQLGLVLVLFIVYVTLEHQTEQDTVAVFKPDKSNVVTIEPNTEVIFIREPKVTPKVEIVKASPFLIDEVVKGDNTIKEFIFDEVPAEDPTVIDIDALVVIKEPEDFKPEDAVPFISLQNAPVFKGCEGLSKEENKICFDKKMKRFVQRNFDADLASDLGLNSGKYKIHTQFIIDDKGNVMDIKIRAPHTKLKKETQQLIEKLPKFTPGKQNDKNVRVRYTLPISFQVD